MAIIRLLEQLCDAGMAVEAGVVLDRVRTGEWPRFALSNDRVLATESFARGGWPAAEGRDEKWAELMARFDAALFDR